MSNDQIDINLKNSANFSSQGGYEKYTRPSDNFVFGDVPNTVHEKGNIIGELFDTTKSELVTDSTLSNSISWDMETGWSFKRGATFNNNEAGYLIAKDKISFEKGKTYLLEVDVDSLSLTNSYIYFRNNNNTGDAWANSYYQITKNGKTEISITAESTVDATLRISGNNGTINYKYISVKKITSIEFPEAPTANVEGLGKELITNGTFNSDLSAWVISSNTAITQESGRVKIVCSDSNNQNLYQEISINPGVTVKVTFDYEYVSGNGGKINLAGDNFVGIWNNTANGLDSSYSTGTITHYYTNDSNSLQKQRFQFMNEGNGTIYFDNISIKEITGLKTTRPYNIGEIVAIDKVNNFDGLTSVHSGIVTSITDGYSISANGNAYGGGANLKYPVPLLIEECEYIISFTVSNLVGKGKVFSDASLKTLSNGEHTILYKGTNNSPLGFNGDNDGTFSADITNIKVELKNDIYQATRNTEDMYDIKTDTSTTYDFKKGYVYYLDSPSAEGIQGHYYLCHNGNYPSRPASSTYFDNEIYFEDLGTPTGYDFAPTLGSEQVLYKTGVIVYIADASITAGATSGHYYKVISGTNTYFNTGVVNFNIGWQDLGTDISGIGNFMSLQNPYFKVQDKVFRYDIAFHRIDKTTKALDTKVFSTFADGIGGWNSHSNDEVAMQDLFDSRVRTLIEKYSAPEASSNTNAIYVADDSIYTIGQKIVVYKGDIKVVEGSITQLDGNNIRIDTTYDREVIEYEISTPQPNSSVNLNKVIGDKNTYEDNDYFYIMIGEVPRLNQGAYHPIFNTLGTKSFRSKTLANEFRVWHANTAISNIHSVANTFDDLYLSTSSSFGTGSIKAPNGNKASDASQTLDIRPDGLFHDKIYPENFGGFTDRRIFTNKYDYNQILSMAKEIQKDRKEAKIVETIQVGTFTEEGSTMSTNAYYTSTDIFRFDFNQELYLTIIGSNGRFESFSRITGGNTATILVEKASQRTVGETYSFAIMRYTNVTVSGSITHVDLIGNPNNYPKDWINYLAQGKSFYFNPLFNDQYGKDLIDLNVAKDVTFSKKSVDAYVNRFWTDDAITWVAQIGTALPIDNINNSLTLSQPNTRLSLFVYKSDADPLKKDIEKRIKVVNPEVIGSNSHQISKYSDISRVINDGFIPTGSTLRQRPLSNTNVYGTPIKASSGTFEWLDGTDMEIDVDIAGSYKGTVIRRNYGDKATADWSFFMTETTLHDFSENLLDVGVSQLPEHVAINLENGKGAKWYNALAVDNQELFLQIHGKTIVKENGDDGIFDESTNDWHGNKIKNGRFNMRLPFRIKE